MSEKKTGIEWFNINIKPILGESFKFRYIDENGGDLGDLSGVQFDSETIGGYIYFWSCGYVGFQLVDYEKGVELVDDTTEEVSSRSYDDIFKELLTNLNQ